VGRECVRSEIRDHFYVYNLENLLRKVEKVCLACKKTENDPLSQHMANSPARRFEQPLQAFLGPV
jgi:hypothetical protein